MPPDSEKARSLTKTLVFPIGNLAPEGSVIKSTAIDASPTTAAPGRNARAADARAVNVLSPSSWKNVKSPS